MQPSKLDLTTFILSVSSAAYFALGVQRAAAESHEAKLDDVNLEMAKQNIDLLELIFEKTQGNRTPDEDRLISQLLFETRMKFVEVQKKVNGK